MKTIYALEASLSVTQGEFSLTCDLQIPHGITAIFGPSGSGKTTLLNCVAGFRTPNAGLIKTPRSIFYSDKQSINLSPEKRRIGYVLQESGLFPHLSVRKNIEYGFNLTPESERIYKVDYLLDALRLAHIADRDPKNLSGGERQRVAIARSLATSPDILLLDEPLASLDAPLRGVLIKILKMVSDELSIPMLYVSHSLSEVIALSDQVFVLAEGAVVAEGPPHILLRSADVRSLADYGTFENIFQGTVLKVDIHNAITIVSVGDTELTLPIKPVTMGQEVMVSIRSSEVILSRDKPNPLSARNIVKAFVVDMYPTKNSIIVECEFGARMFVEITVDARRELNISPSMELHMIIKASSVMLLTV